MEKLHQVKLHTIVSQLQRKRNYVLKHGCKILERVDNFNFSNDSVVCSVHFDTGYFKVDKQAIVHGYKSKHKTETWSSSK